MTEYTLRIHASDVDIPLLGTYRHSGYDLIVVDDSGNKKMYSIDFSTEDTEDATINIKESSVYTIINNNGQIDNGTELFGNNSVLSSGEKAANGFEALADLDSNGDNIFNNQDEAWNEVKVWKDTNSNGVVDEGELLTLEQANVYKANITNQNSNSFFYR